jgi:tetratricopeptide (TPR) repeat protein
MSSTLLEPEIERQKQTIDRLNEEAYDNRYNNTALTEKLAQDALQLARKIHYQEGEAWALRNLGIAKAIQGKGEEALQHLQEALQIFERLDNFRGLGLTLSNLGTVHQQMGILEKAAQYLTHSLRYLELLPELSFFYAQTLGNLGSLFAELEQFDLAFEYHQKALAIHRANNYSRGAFFSHVTLATLHRTQGQWAKAEEEAQAALDIASELGEKDLIVRALLVQAEIKAAQHKRGEALPLLSRAEELANTLQNPALLAQVLASLIDTCLILGETQRARTALERFEALQKEVSDRTFTYFLPDFKARLAEQEGRWEEAYRYLKEYSERRLALAQSLNKNTLAALDRILRQELKGTTSLLHGEIAVAKRLQEVILHGEAELRQVFPNSVYYFRPKEIIGGDFLFVGKGKDGAQLLAVVDASGAGASAAILSTMAHTLLYEIFLVRGVTDPGRILSQLHKSLTDLLYPPAKKTSPELENISAEGFQVGICTVFPNLGEVHYAGGLIPLWAFNPVLKSWEALQPDKRLIGQKGEESGPRIYNSTILPIEKGSVLFFFTDGWERLVSGHTGKRFGRSGIRDWLAENAPHDLQTWFEALKTHIEEWRGNAALTDDMLLVAVQI